MITRFGMAPRSAGMSIEAFRHHWRTSHADAAGQIPGVRRYTQNHSLLDEHGHYVLGYPGFDACSELDFDSVAAMEAGFASETYRTLVVDDENDFVDKTRFSLVVTDATIVTDGPTNGIKLIRMFRSHPSSDRRSLLANAEQPGFRAAGNVRPPLCGPHTCRGGFLWSPPGVRRGCHSLACRPK